MSNKLQKVSVYELSLKNTSSNFLKMNKAIIILTFPILIESLVFHHLLYKRILPFDSQDATNFKVIATYPKPIPSATVCAGYAAANMRNPIRSPNQTHHINAFKYTEEDQSCKIGTIPYWHLKDIPTWPEIEEPGIMVYQGCYLKNWNKTKMFEDFPPEMELYFPGDDNIMYEKNENTQLSPVSPSKFTLAMGESFLTSDNRKTFLSLENGQGSFNDQRFLRASVFSVSDFTLMAWFHGRNVDGGVRPIINIHHPGHWQYHTISLIIGCSSTYSNKLCCYFYDHGVSGGFVGGSDIEIDFSRWTHLAMTFDQTNKLAYFYVDGVQAGPAVSMNAHHVNTLQEITLSGHSYGTNDRCHCSLADVILLKKRLTNEEIRNDYEKYLTGDDCPFNNN